MATPSGRIAAASRRVGGQEVDLRLVAAARRDHEDDQVMDDRRIPRPHLRCPDPDVLLELGVDHEVLVGHRPLGGDLDLLGQGDHQVGGRDAPALDIVRRLGQVARVALGRPGGDPGGDRLLFVVAQPGVVGELAVLGAGVPGGHAAALNHLVDHLGPAGGLLVVAQGKRGDLPLAVAGDATVAEDPGHMLRVGDGRIGPGLGDPADLAADGLGPRRGDRPAGEQVVERRGELAPRRGRTMDAKAELVVDPPAIPDDPVRVQHEDLRRPLDGQPIGQLVAHVFQQRERQVVLPGKPGQRRGGILLIGVNAEESDAFLLVGCAPARRASGRTGSPAGIRSPGRR